MAQLVRAPARRAGDPVSNPGPGENFALKVLIIIKGFQRHGILFHGIREIL